MVGVPLRIGELTGWMRRQLVGPTQVDIGRPSNKKVSN